MLENKQSRRSFIQSSALGAAAVAGMGATGLTAGGISCSSSSRPAQKPNILYLMTDQHRGDCLGVVNDAIATPNLDSVAQDGVVFTNAFTSLPSCTPARSSVLSGLSPWHHGMLGYGRIASQYPFELPQAVRDAGYYCWGIGKMHWYPQKDTRGYHGTQVDESGRAESPGFISDYRRWFYEQAPDLDPDATGIGFNDYRAWQYLLPEELHPTVWTANEAVEFIDEYDLDEPFMLKVSFARPHSPYDPPERWFDAYSDDDMPDRMVGDWADKYREPALPIGRVDDPWRLWRGDLGESTAKRARRGYYGSVSFIDEQIGRVLATLKKRGMYDNTLIIFFADHGDMLGDHHHWRKTYAYQGSANIPMILKWPKGFGMDDARNTLRKEPVELRDVLPTFLDAAGAPIPSHLDGRSMLAMLRGEQDAVHEHIDLEHDQCYAPENHWNALSDGRVKYIWHCRIGEEQLFDLENDPGELHDLAINPSHKPLLDEWRDRMIEHLQERGEPFVKGRRLLVRNERMLYSPHFPGWDA